MKQKILGVLRHALTTTGGFLIAKGLLTVATVEAIGGFTILKGAVTLHKGEIILGALITLAGFAWSIKSKGLAATLGESKDTKSN